MCQIKKGTNKIYCWLKNKFGGNGIPTDMKILETIYSLYLEDFLNYSQKIKPARKKFIFQLRLKK